MKMYTHFHFHRLQAAQRPDPEISRDQSCQKERDEWIEMTPLPAP